MRNPRTRSPKGGAATAENGGHSVANCWHGKKKQVDQAQGKAGTASLSSPSSTLMATDVGAKEMGLIESVSEGAEKSWLCGRGFCGVNQFSMDG